MLRSDAVLERDVAQELACDVHCRMAKIDVAVKNGVVTLSGTVPSLALRTAALRAAKRVFGVEGIDPRLEIAPDAVYSAVVAEALAEQHSTIPSPAVAF